MTSGRSATLALMLACLATAVQAQPASPDQIAEGQKFAERVCGACHVVTNDPNEIPIRRPPGPSFAELAKWPKLTEQSLRQLLTSNHHDLGATGAMPNPRLADYQIDRVVAYLLSLKPTK